MSFFHTFFSSPCCEIVHQKPVSTHEPTLPLIDLRSDTVTKPTTKMREAMANAVVGDDVYQEDPTVNALQTRVAALFQKEAALFFPTGTMANLAAVMVWCPRRGSEIIVGDKSHLFLYEQAGVCQFGGVSVRTVPNQPDGTMRLQDILSAIRENDIHEPTTQLICLENTHNVTGGRVLSIDYIEKVRDITAHSYLPIHMDGSRIWNAATALQKPVHELVELVDSVTVCLSKGLGAPVGSLLVGSSEFIERARRIRKGLGGGMRQSGILAAAGMEALDDFENGILKKDHELTQRLYGSIRLLKSFRVHSSETNILFLDIVLYDKTWAPNSVSENIEKLFLERGILVSAWSPFLLRVVLHRDISEADMVRVIHVFQEIDSLLHS